MNKRKIAKTLRIAAGILDLSGWCRNVIVSYDGAHCAAGALEAASDVPELDSFNMLKKYLGIVGPLAQWNDNVAKDAAEVASVMRGCARWLEHGGPERPSPYAAR